MILSEVEGDRGALFYLYLLLPRCLYALLPRCLYLKKKEAPENRSLVLIF